MRLIGTMRSPEEAARFSAILTGQGIENKLEYSADTDWGSEGYGDKEIRVWVIQEDDLEKSMDLLKRFFEKPEDPVFEAQPNKEFSMPVDKPQPKYLLTLYFLISCVILFAASLMTAPSRERIAVPYPYTAIYSSEVTQSFLFDFPKAYEILETIVDAYGVAALKNPEKMPREGQILLQEYRDTPYWQGFYDEFVRHLQGKPPAAWESEAPLFEQIRQGQVWRLFTPALLHADIFHLLFNMLWLFVLGRQIEERIKPLRYLLFILAVGIFSNICQYMMSGPNFIGFSGILCGMFTFIWIRQRKAPWEGYQLHRSTILFIGLFILAMFLLQVASFFSEVYTNKPIAPLIANTAHLTGALAGVILGRMNFFAWKQ